MGRVHIAAWQAAYRGLMPDAYLDVLDPVARGQRWRTALSGGCGGGRYRVNGLEGLALVVEDDGGGVPGLAPRVAGIAVAGPDRGGEEPPVGELWMINLAPQAWGRGLGTTLLAAAVDELGRAGHPEALLWVVAGNARARRFYEREGWEPDGGRYSDDARGFQVDEVRYRRTV